MTKNQPISTAAVILPVGSLPVSRLSLSCVAQILLFNDGGRDRAFITMSEYVLALSGLLVIFVLFVKNKLGFIVNRVTLFPGSISYPLYLIHQYIAREILMPFFWDYFYLSLFVSAIIILLLMMAIASVISRYVEVPLGIRLKQALLHLREDKTHVS